MMSFSLRMAVVALMLTTAVALGLILLQIAHPVRLPVPVQASVPPPLQAGYLVAAHPLPAGTLARDEDFAVRTVPVAEVPQDSMPDTPAARASLRGALIRGYLDAGAMLTVSDVLRPRDRGFIASVLAPGTRAVSIGVDPISGVAGLIWPGDHVDVILTQQLDKAPVGQRVLSETILANVRTIAIDQEIVQGAPSGTSAAGKLARTVTLQVTPDQAEKIAVAQNLGKLALAIRAAEDRPGATADAQITTFGADVSPALSSADRTVGATVQVFQGDKHQEVTFR